MSELNENQELFCQYYVSKDCFANGTRAYMEAYNIDPNDKGGYAAARSSASDFLTNPNILKRINELLDYGGFNDVDVDKELLFVINQKNDLTAKVAAIREYNKLKQRITEKLDLTSKGEKIIPILGGATNVQGNDSNKETTGTEEKN